MAYSAASSRQASDKSLCKNFTSETSLRKPLRAFAASSSAKSENPPAWDKRRNRRPDNRAAAAGPKACAAHLRIGLAGNFVRTSRMPWRVPAREARHRQVEAAPEKVDGAALADKARAECLEHPIGPSLVSMRSAWSMKSRSIWNTRSPYGMDEVVRPRGVT
jgi:hypothetical protein